ncbi:MAG: C40 family peptidase [Clostridiales bacterium]|nr:C40 family peptidase [Clostridiales bacterium]
MERVKAGLRTAAILFLFLILLLAAGAAAADEHHTFALNCGGGGFVGRSASGEQSMVIPVPDEAFSAGEDREWTLEELRGLPDFRLEGAALRFTADSVQGYDLWYELVCGNTGSSPVTVRTGRNLWDVTEPLRVWMDNPGQRMRIAPMYSQGPWGMQVAEGSISLQITFSTSAKLPLFPMDRIRYSSIYENSLCMLEEGSAFVEKYDDTADSLMEVMLPLGVPYYYAGGSEEKFLHRFVPSTTTHYYLESHMYLCGLDCVGMTRLVYEKCGLERHPSISNTLARGVGHSALGSNGTERWYMLLQPGDLVCVKHGTFHVMMYLGTMRMFGWTEANAGEAASLLDEPLVIHCGGNPFYYDRYKVYISEKGYRNTMPPDGGVTVSVIRQTDADAPHSRDVFWGKHFGWYNIRAGQPLLVFRLEDCTDLAWYGPLGTPAAE